MDIQKILVFADKICDYIPVVSTVTNLIDLFQKYAILPLISSSSLAQSNYYKHINKKSFSRCAILLIPGSNLFIGIRDYQKTIEKTEKVRREKLANDLRTQTQETKNINELKQDTFAQIFKFVKNDPELLQKYNECLERTKETLLPPHELRKSSPTGNPVVDAWSEQQHLKVHLESEVTRFDDFMQKNPDFLELFTQKYYDKFSQQYHRPNINDID